MAMAIESAVSSKEEKNLINQRIQSSVRVGGQGALPMTCSGNYVSSLTAYSLKNEGSLVGISLLFDNGTVAMLGSPDANCKSNTLDLSSDSIAKIYVWINSTVDGLYIETTKGNTYFSFGGDGNGSTTPFNTPEKWALVTADSGDPLQNVVLVGMGYSQDSGIAFLYKNDALMTRIIEDMEYSNLTTSPSTPINVASATVHNQTDQTQEMSVSFEKSVSSSYTRGVEAGGSVTLGVSATFKVKIPIFAEADTTASASATVSFSASFGVEHTTSEAFSYTAMVSVPSNSKVTAKATAASYSINGRYTAKFIECWAHAGLVTKVINGTIDGLAAYSVTVDYSSI
jgi:hypothetical protein